MHSAYILMEFPFQGLNLLLAYELSMLVSVNDLCVRLSHQRLASTAEPSKCHQACNEAPRSIVDLLFFSSILGHTTTPGRQPVWLHSYKSVKAYVLQRKHQSQRPKSLIHTSPCIYMTLYLCYSYTLICYSQGRQPQLDSQHGSDEDIGRPLSQI